MGPKLANKAHSDLLALGQRLGEAVPDELIQPLLQRRHHLPRLSHQPAAEAL